MFVVSMPKHPGLKSLYCVNVRTIKLHSYIIKRMVADIRRKKTIQAQEQHCKFCDLVPRSGDLLDLISVALFLKKRT